MNKVFNYFVYIKMLLKICFDSGNRDLMLLKKKSEGPKGKTGNVLVYTIQKIDSLFFI